MLDGMERGNVLQVIRKVDGVREGYIFLLLYSDRLLSAKGE